MDYLFCSKIYLWNGYKSNKTYQSAIFVFQSAKIALWKNRQLLIY